MTIKSTITVGNNFDLGFDAVEIETSCHGFVDLLIPLKAQSNNHLKIELSRKDLREFLARTCPAFVTSERYEASVTSAPNTGLGQ